MKNLFISIFIAIILCISGCSTVQPHIENINDYEIFPITTNWRFFFRWDYILGNYRLREGSNNRLEGSGITVFTSEWAFLEGNFEICKVEIIRREVQGLFIGRLELFGRHTRYVKFIYKNGRRVEYQIDVDPHIYLTIQNNNDIIEIKNYYFKNMEFPASPIGFDIFVNNERYGILTFSPPTFHLLKGNELNSDMALFILAAYVSYIWRTSGSN